MPLTLGEIFEQTKKLVNIPQRVKVLQENASPALFYILRLALTEPAPKWLLPDETPVFTPFQVSRGGHKVEIKPGMSPSNLSRDCRRLYMFLEGGHPTLQNPRRVKLFAQMLEGLDPWEVKVLLALKNGTFAADYRINKKVVDTAFPGLLDMPWKTVQFIPQV